MRFKSNLSRRLVPEYVVALALAVTCHAIFAQEQSPSDSNDMEEIVVYGDKSVRELRLEFYDAQESFFSVFNSLNSDDDLNIECEFQTPLGERRKYRVCAPKFSENAQASASAQYVLSMHLARAQKEAPDFDAAKSSAFPHDARARRKEKLMWEEMDALLSERSELQEALTDLVEAKNKYESARQKD